MIEIQQHGSIVNGEWISRREDVLHAELQEAGNVDDCVMTIHGTNKRTLDQNSYAWVVCTEIAKGMRDAGWVEVTKDDVYYRIEEKHCKTVKYNPEEGKMMETKKPLKCQESDRFWDIIEQVRINAIQNLDIEISTAAEHYGLTESAYDLMKQGVINYAEAKKMSKDKMIGKIEEQFA